VIDVAAAIDEEKDNGDEPEVPILCNFNYGCDNMGNGCQGKRPKLKNVLAQKQAYQYFEKHWKTINNLPPLENVNRPISPGYHSSLSEALSNFSLYCVGPIVKEFNGQLIYCGGDDVLAMLPAQNALDCAQALQFAFRGVNPNGAKSNASEKVKDVLTKLFDYDRHIDGFMKLKPGSKGVGRAEHLKPNWYLMVMGPNASMSAGIAIGHVHSPMQDTILEARQAEKKAKKVDGKNSFCLSILKRSGETVSFSAKWDSGAPGIWSELNFKLLNLSSGFAYRFSELAKELLVVGVSDDGMKFVKDWERCSTFDGINTG
jgi:CRISPR-associated protein Cmr2